MSTVSFSPGETVHHKSLGVGQVVGPSASGDEFLNVIFNDGQIRSIAVFGLFPDAESARAFEPSRTRPSANKPSTVHAKPFEWRDPAKIPPRDFLYGTHYARTFVSATAAPGGTGKSAHAKAEALAMLTGRTLLGVEPRYPSLNVWYWNLEDPLDEIERGFAAVRMHHRVQGIAGQLFVNSGRETPLVIGSKVRDQAVIAEPVVEALVTEIVGKAIDVIIVDPFISSHEVPENDNGGIDKIVKAWGRVAGNGNCAVELIHHTKKMGGEAMSEESFRGAKSFVDGLRSGRVLHRMSEADAGTMGVAQERKRYFYTMPEKQSLAPPAEERAWFRLASVEIGNGDNVGAVEAWQPPNPFDDVSADDLAKVQDLLRPGTYRQSDQADDWGGYAVATVLGLDAGSGLKAAQRNAAQKAARGKIKHLLRTWEMNGAISVEVLPDSKRMPRAFYCVPDAAE